MFDREIKLNRFLLHYLDQVVADIPADQLTHRPPGGGHPPVWVLGHLAIVAEIGQTLLGGQIQHPEWVPLFGPTSPDDVPSADRFAKDDLVQQIHTAYRQLVDLVRGAEDQVLSRPHGVKLLDNTPMETVADMEAHLLTAHFSFHLAQLSGWRRANGQGPLL